MKLKSWLKNKKAEVGVGTIVTLAVAFLLIAILVPIIMTQVVGTTTTGWNAAVIVIFSTLTPILFIIGVAIKFIPHAKGGGDWIEAPKRLLRNQKGEITAGTIVLLAVGFLLVAILTPIAMTQIITACSTTWGTATYTIFTVLLPILFLIGVAIRYVPHGGK